MSLLVAGAFLTFLGFLFAGLLALAVTAALDRHIGKEKALLLWSGVLLLFALWQCAPDVARVRATAKADSKVPSGRLEAEGDPLKRPGLGLGVDARNPFQKHSDTRPLPPIAIETPPWLPLPLSLPPTVPGPAPTARRLLRGAFPTASVGDGSSIPTIPDPEFAEYAPAPLDVYDLVVKGGRKTYAYIRSIREGGTWYDEGDPRYDALKWALVRKTPGWDALEVDLALVGSEEVAGRSLGATDVLKRKRENRSTVAATQFDEWTLRSSVDNLYTEVLRRHAIDRDLTATDVAALRQAAAEMAAVGRTGKEAREGWRRAVLLLQRALVVAREKGVPALRAEVLQELVDAYTALQDEEAVLRTLSEYARVSPTRPEPWLWLGQLYLLRLGLPQEALGFFEAALVRAPRSPEALLGQGDALTALGRHADALAVYRKAGGEPAAKVRVAEAALRVGDLAAAATAAEGALSGEATARAALAHGAVLYARGDLDKARAAFERAALLSGDVAGDALEYRAQACYDLGLTCWRLGQADASLAAFEACERALRFGSAPRRSADEAVSPAFGRALVALVTGNVSELHTSLQEARDEAPDVSYHDYLAGVVAAQAGNDAAAARSFARALESALVYPELDGWLAHTRLLLARQAAATGTPEEETARDFQAAVAFAARATTDEEAADPKAFRAALREAWVRLHAEHLPARRRFEEARAVADRVLKRIDREQPGALSIRGYCNYRLAALGAVEEGYDPCIRDFQQVLDKVPPGDEGEWRPWRDYAATLLAAVKHWLELEEKVVAFDGTSLPPGFERKEPSGVRASVEDGLLRVTGNARADGSYLDPTILVYADDLMTVGALEEVRLRVRIPTHDARGVNVNTITFGVEIVRAGGSSGRGSAGLPPGIGLFYDRGKVAVRLAGGRDERWKAGEMVRVQPELEWPAEGGWAEIRIVREDAGEGLVAVYLDTNLDDDLGGQKIAEDVLGTFKGGGRATARFQLLGWSTQAQEYDVEVQDLRVIRRRK